MTNDGLVAFNQASGLAGTQLVPDLAVSLPTPTNDGKTYVFHLRPGIRYSTEGTVRPPTSPPPPSATSKPGVPRYSGGIVGANRCIERPRRCDLSHGIVANDAARTVTFHLVAPDPDFLYKLALPYAFVLPAGTPRRDSGTRPLPATGPYVIATTGRKLLTLVRNPRSTNGRSRLSPTATQTRSSSTWSNAGRGGEGGDRRPGRRLCCPSQSPRPRPAEQLQTRYAGQVRTNPQPAGLRLLPEHERSRRSTTSTCGRAMNIAADRGAAVRWPEAPGRPGDLSDPSLLTPRATRLLSLPGHPPPTGSLAAPDLPRRGARRRFGHQGRRSPSGRGGPSGASPRTREASPVPRIPREGGDRFGLTGLLRPVGDSRTKAQMGTLPGCPTIRRRRGSSPDADLRLVCSGARERERSGFCDPRIDAQMSDALPSRPRIPRPHGVCGSGSTGRPSTRRRGCRSSTRGSSTSSPRRRQLPVQPAGVDAHRPALGP